jgi:hypothetical protein
MMMLMMIIITITIAIIIIIITICNCNLSGLGELFRALKHLIRSYVSANYKTC